MSDNNKSGNNNSMRDIRAWFQDRPAQEDNTVVDHLDHSSMYTAFMAAHGVQLRCFDAFPAAGPKGGTGNA